MQAAAPETLRFVEQDMDEAVLVELAGGTAAAYSARGPDRTGPNEDAAAVLSTADGRAVLVVADGLGGQPQGASASRIALDCLESALRTLDAERSLRGAILDAVELANRQLIESGTGAATTFAALELGQGTLRPYHVGDSAILVVGQRGRVKLRTVAHSPVGYAVESGLLDPREALHHDERHVISNVVGSRDMRIEVGSCLQLAPCDTTVLATDGLLDNLQLEELIEIVRAGPLARASRSLVERCRARMCHAAAEEPSKPDDLTFVLFRARRK